MGHPKLLNASDASSVRLAAAVLKEGGLVAFPTETVYGLGADALNAKAVCRIFEAKKRPEFDPLIVHVASTGQARGLWKETPAVADALMEAFWPGPLTIILPKQDLVPDVVTAGLPTVAVRMPKHSVALDLIRQTGCPIAAPSANLFGHLSPTTAWAVLEDLAESVDWVLDGGASALGIESTVLKIVAGECFLLRPGAVTLEEIVRITPVTRPARIASSEAPGLSDTHYAPWTPTVLMRSTFSDFIRELCAYHKICQHEKRALPRLGLLAFTPKENAQEFESVEILSASGDLLQAASNLFEALRKLDKMQLDFIVAESVPESGIGLAIMDRLRKASGGRTDSGGLANIFGGNSNRHE